MKTTLSIGIVSLLAIISIPVLAQSTVSVQQQGTGQQATVRQEGSGSQVQINQSGGQNQAIIRQSGSGGHVVVRQQTNAAGSDSTQSRANRIQLNVEKGTQTQISQQGPGPHEVTITQSGNGQTTVQQSSGPATEGEKSTPARKNPSAPKTRSLDKPSDRKH